MTDDDKEFIIRALAMHAALTQTFPDSDIDERAWNCERWIRRSISGVYATHKENIYQEMLARKEQREKEKAVFAR